MLNRHPVHVPKRWRRGTVLIFSVGVLSVLAILAATFATLCKVERNVSRNYVDHVRSMMLAESGIEMSVARLNDELKDPTRPGKHAFYGEDLNENGKEDNGEDVDGDGWQTTTCPLDIAPHPSFMMRLHGDGSQPPDAQDLISCAGRKIGVSGILPGTYTQNGDFYAVKVTDLSQKINVNMDGHPHLQTVLQNLTEEAGLGRAMGDRVYQNRPYGSILELRDKCRLTQAQTDILANFLTVHSWADKKVVNPVPIEERIRGGLGDGTMVFTWEEVRPRKINFAKDSKGNVTGRCPVNINLAPREVLVALIRGLSGFFLQEAARDTNIRRGYDILDLHYTYTNSPTRRGGRGRGSWLSEAGALGRIKYTTALTATRARRVADAIIRHRETVAPFRTWQDFDKFLWDEVWGRGILARTEIDVLKANFNPNSNMNAFNPEYQLFHWVDKTDLKYWTTEFSLGPTGYYEIESIGRVVNGNRDIVAEAKLLVDLKMFDIYRECSQKDFLYDFWKNGKEIKDNIISRNRGTGKTRSDLSLTTFPELPDRDFVKDADYDGHISLATRETAGNGAAFRASFSEHGLNADSGQPRIPDINGPYMDRLVNQRGGTSAWKPGKLFPDGVYSELDSVPMYQFTPTDQYDFSVSLWMKPHYFPEHAGRTRTILTWQHKVEHPAARFRRYQDLILPLGIYNTVTAFIEDKSMGGYEYQDAWDTPAILAGGCVEHWEGAVGTPCLNHLEHGHQGIVRGGQFWGTMMEGGKWMHIGWVHHGAPFVAKGKSFHPHTHHEDMDLLYVNGEKVSGIFGYQTSDVANPTDYQTEPLRLGERRSFPKINSVPDATLDQVLVWNGVLLPKSEQQLLSEWNDGRFYNEDDATFTSRSIDFGQEIGAGAGAPINITSVAWTGYIPESLSKGKITVELVKAYDHSALPNGRIYTDAGGEKVGIGVHDPIRYIVHFQPGTAGSRAVVDTLVFNDITFTVTRGPQFLSWAWD